MVPKQKRTLKCRKCFRDGVVFVSNAGEASAKFTSLGWTWTPSGLPLCPKCSAKKG